MRNPLRIVMIFAFTWTAAFGQNPADIWYQTAEDQIPESGARLIQPDKYAVWAADLTGLQAALDQAPVERSGETSWLTVPRPDGSVAWFAVENSPVMAPELAARYPEIQTFRGYSPAQPNVTMRCGFTPAGFHAIVFDEDGVYYVDPYQRGDQTHHVSYFTKDYQMPEGLTWSCLFSDENPAGVAPPPPPEGVGNPIGDELLTYRLALACTGEYATFHGGTTGSVMAEMTTAMNRVNGIYERDLSIFMEIVPNNDQIIFLNSLTDPYSNFNPSALLAENQTTCDTIIGSANYDVGHVFSTGGGGLASLGVVCSNGSKARGETGLSQPTGDPFYVDFVAHELGHQFAGNHTFNGSTGNCFGFNRNGSTAWEPGSGSTIMAYAGICGSENLQQNSDDYFHTGSYDEIVNFTRGFATCAATTPVANAAPSVDAGPNYTIPQSTPFMLTGSATDTDGSGGTLTFCWEQFDLGNPSPPNTDDGTRPIFRSFDPTTSPTRFFPRLSDILNNTSTLGESLPTTNRTLTFRLTVRDNNPGAGGVDHDEAVLTVDANSGPFEATAPNTAVTWDGNTQETVTWDVAGTAAAPVSCANVDILLSTDGGQTFNTVILDDTANDGTQTITVPNVATTTARIMIVCSDNVFFDITDANFTIIESALECTTNPANWLAPTLGQFIDSNNNGLVDVADFVNCIVVPRQASVQ